MDIAAVIAHLKNFERETEFVAQHLPGHQIGVMFRFGNQNFVAGLQVFASPAGGNQINRLGGIAGKNNFLLRSGVDEIRGNAARIFIFRGRLLGQIIRSAVHVGILPEINLVHFFDNLPRFLRRRSGIEKRVRFAVNQFA